MRYSDVCPAGFCKRINRFTALVDLEHGQETVHVKNTGRLGELLYSGARIMLSHESGPKRKTAYDLISVRKEGVGWVNIDSQASNRVAAEWLETKPKPFEDLLEVKPEYSYGQSRIDFMLRCEKRRILLEIKGCTLEKGGIGLFPDAPTLRGVKHLEELSRARLEGWEAYIGYVIAVPGVTRVIPNRSTHPQYAQALESAKACGVKILYLPCIVSPDEIFIQKEGVSIE